MSCPPQSSKKQTTIFIPFASVFWSFHNEHVLQNKMITILKHLLVLKEGEIIGFKMVSDKILRENIPTPRKKKHTVSCLEQ